MSKKGIDTSKLVNELRGNSVFFQPRPPSPVLSEDTSSAPLHDEPASPRKESVRTDKRTNVRKKIRHAFDIWEDQIIDLREIVVKRHRTHGQRCTLGDLAQEAFEAFIQKEK